MSTFKKAALVLPAAEAARQWAHNNPDTATTFINRATDFVDQRTGRKYTRALSKASVMAAKNLTEGRPGTRPYPDMRA